MQQFITQDNLSKPGADMYTVVIGAGVGAPQALSTVLRDFPSTFPGSIIVIPNMGKGFTNYLANKLGKECALPVTVAKDGQLIKPSSILLIPSEYNARIESYDDYIDNYTVELSQHDNVTRKHQFDNMLCDAADISSRRTIAVVLTGTGEDGVKGAKAVKDSGGIVIAQDEASSVCHDVAAKIIEADLADYVSPLWSIATLISAQTVDKAHSPAA